MSTNEALAPCDVYQVIPDIDRYARQFAHLTRAKFAALLEEGFSREEALALCVGSLPMTI